MSCVNTFLDKIFCAKQRKDNEHQIVWRCKNSGVQFPISREKFIKMQEVDGYYSAYFGTSTMRAQPDGKIFNRQVGFSGYYVVVLDDVGCGAGAKSPMSKLPQQIREGASYCIETSPDNFQLGFVLEKPIRDIDEAKQLQRDVIVALGTDSGGLLVNKAVRLPSGYNLKTNKDGSYKYIVDGEPFQCRLVEFTDRRWTADELRKAAGVTKYTTLQTSKVCGVSLLNKKHAHFVAAKGVVDPVYEWLQDTQQVLCEGVDWITIECPNHESHTSGEKVAGYSPLGFGDKPHRRGFHCFHDSCRTFTTREFLHFVYHKSGIRASILSGVCDFVARYAFVTAQNSVVDMMSGDFSHVGQVGFKNQLSGLVPVPSKKQAKESETPSIEYVSEYSLYMTDPARLRINDLTHKPGEPLLIERGEGAYPDLNVYRTVHWNSVKPDLEKVKPFINFVKYLCPDDGDAEWLLSHLAAKAQNVHYRGLGVIMTTPVEGTGRGTLSRIISMLWSKHNVKNISLQHLVSGTAHDKWNAYMCADWLIVSEAKECDVSNKQERLSYESLKTFIELNAVEIQLQEKWEKAYSATCYGSVLINSQHADVIPGDMGTTRFKRILNTRQPWGKKEWLSFNAWIDNSGFEEHLWSWFLERDISNHQTIVRSKPISQREATINAIQFDRTIQSAIAICLLYADDVWRGLLKPAWCIEGLANVALKLKLDDLSWWQKSVKKELTTVTRELKKRPRIEGVSERLRCTVHYDPSEILEPSFTKATFIKKFSAFVIKFYEDEGL